MQKLNNLIAELNSNIPNLENRNLAVSNATVGWQIEHSLRVLSRIISALEKSNPNDYKSKFNFKRFLIFTTNKIPRGKVKAPQIVQPIDAISINSLKENLEKVKIKIATLDTLPKNNFFPHPFLNDLNVKQTQKFLVLHTMHHLKIIRDIVKL